MSLPQSFLTQSHTRLTRGHANSVGPRRKALGAISPAPGTCLASTLPDGADWTKCRALAWAHSKEVSWAVGDGQWRYRYTQLIKATARYSFTYANLGSSCQGRSGQAVVGMWAGSSVTSGGAGRHLRIVAELIWPPNITLPVQLVRLMVRFRVTDRLLSGTDGQWFYSSCSHFHCGFD